MILRITLLLFITLSAVAQSTAVVRSKNLKRREAAFGFGGNPASVYGVPQQPHREYGVPQHIPFREYGPPHPQLQYGPPKLNSLGVNIGIPKPIYGPPHRPTLTYGPPPQRLPSQPFHQYGPPKQNYGPPSAVYGPPQQLPLVHTGHLFKPLGQHPISSYGPPASGPLNNFIVPVKQIQIPPQQSYGPPPLPIQLPGSSFHRVPETKIILTRPVLQQHQQQQTAINQGHFPINDHGPAITACDGWKPIPAPAGHYIEQNSIDTQSGYNEAHSGASGHHITQYNNGGGGGGPGGLSDDQLVAIALQHGHPASHSTIEVPLPLTAPAVDFHHEDRPNLNAVDSDASHVPEGINGDSYSRPPADSFAPNSVHAHNYQTLNIGGESGGLAQPENSYGAPQAQVLPSGNLGIDYGKQSGNLQPWLNNHGVNAPPQKPVSYRPPVPVGLLESIGATVQHHDQFGVKPVNQPQSYIPPPSKEIAGGDNTDNQQNVPTDHRQEENPIYDHESNRNNFNHQQISPLLQPPLFQQSQQHFINIQAQQPVNSEQYQQQHQFVHLQALPQAQEARFNQPQDCGHGPNLVENNAQFNNLQQQQFFQQQQQHPQHQQSTFQSIAQSIPVAEQHSQYLTGPANTYGPPQYPGEPIGYASQRNSVVASPLKTEVETEAKNLPGLEGLNVLSAQKSHSIQIAGDYNPSSPSNDYQLQLQGTGHNQQYANHKDILSNGLLRTVLNAIDDPTVPADGYRENAQSRSDINVAEHEKTETSPANSAEIKSDDTTESESESHEKEENIPSENDDKSTESSSRLF